MVRALPILKNLHYLTCPLNMMVCYPWYARRQYSNLHYLTYLMNILTMECASPILKFALLDLSDEGDGFVTHGMRVANIQICIRVDLSDEGDGFVTHGMRIANIRLDNGLERLLNTLQEQLITITCL
jgi:hypothetical protein